jgi:aminoglycoside phosphotransferase (APT) family kinase protein
MSTPQQLPADTAAPASPKAGRLFLPAGRAQDEELRDNPPSWLADRVDAAFPTEDEYRRVLARKLRRRASGPYTVPSLSELRTRLHDFLSAHIEGDFTVTGVRWLTGGASKIQLAFDLTWDAPGQGRITEPLVVRMEPAESLNATSRLREFQVIRALHGTIPVPVARWLDPDGTWLPEPAIVYSLVRGTTKPRGDRLRVSGTGTRFPASLRAALAPQFVAHLAALHTFDWRGADLSAFTVPRVGTTESALWQLNRVRRVWEEDRGEDFPLVELAANWLEGHLPELDVVSLLHGDFRSGNFMFDEETGEITGWLDWERGYLGDRHRDLAWTMLRLFGSHDEETGEFLVSGLVPESRFLAEYERLSGLPVDRTRLRWYRVLNAYQMMVSNFATGYRVVKLGRSHQDVLLALVEGAVYSLAQELLDALEEVPHGARPMA